MAHFESHTVLFAKIRIIQEVKLTRHF